MRKLFIAVLALCALAPEGWAQNAITQEGTVLQNSPMMFRGNNRARQGATVNGAPKGQTVDTGDSVVGGRCDYSAPTDDPAGYYRMCIDAKSGTVTLDGTKTPPHGTIKFNIDGNTYDILTTAGGVGFDAVGTNAALLAAPTTAYPNGVWRITYGNNNGAPPLYYKPSTSACSLNSGNGDNGSQVKSLDGKCWLAMFPDAPLIEQFGADATAATDSSAIILACANYVSANGANYCRKLATSKVLIDTSISFPIGSGLDCGQGAIGNPGIDWTNSPYEKMGSVQLASAATINYNSLFLWRNCLTYRKGMTFPATDSSGYAGTAFRAVGNSGVGANDAVFENDLTIGFDLILDARGDRLRVNGFHADGNNCMVLNASYDTSSLDHIRCYPYGTVALNGCPANTTTCQRSGVGIAVYSSADDTTFGADVIVNGYKKNFYLNGVNIHLAKIWSDGGGNGDQDSIGVHFGPASNQITVGTIMNFGSMGTGILIDPSVGYISIGNIQSQMSLGDCMRVYGGHVSIANWQSNGCGGWHINDDNHAGTLSIQYLAFYNFQMSNQACPIGLTAGINSDHAYFGRVAATGGFQCVIGGYTLAPPNVSITGNLLTLSGGATSSSHYFVTGSSGTITAMTEGYGPKTVTLTFQYPGLTINNSAGCTIGQFATLSGASITTVALKPYTFIFDGQGTGCWRQVS